MSVFIYAGSTQFLAVELLVAGGLLPFDTTGIDFAMTALFVVLVVEQWKTHRNHLPAIAGFAVTIAALYIFGAERFLIPSLIVISVILMCMKGAIKPEESHK